VNFTPSPSRGLSDVSAQVEEELSKLNQWITISIKRVRCIAGKAETSFSAPYSLGAFKVKSIS